jgi:hypothetical protein
MVLSMISFQVGLLGGQFREQDVNKSNPAVNIARNEVTSSDDHRGMYRLPFGVMDGRLFPQSSFL